MDTDLYSMGAFFCDQHPDLVEEVVGRSEVIEQRGLALGPRVRNPGRGGIPDPADRAAVRYYKALAG